MIKGSFSVGESGTLLLEENFHGISLLICLIAVILKDILVLLTEILGIYTVKGRLSNELLGGTVILFLLCLMKTS